MRERANWLFGRVVARGGRVRAFTLVELIVAVGAVALLTVGVGQVFRSVGSLVSTGSAVAEIEQLARAVEAQMRADFAALNRMREDEVFMAIRCRRVGDINLDGSLETNEYMPGFRWERPLYLTPEDREADQKDGIAPYGAGSRAVTRRLDEIMFLGFGGDGGLYHSYTPTCKSNAVTECDACERDVSADTVRIYYGHGLRPAIDASEFDVGVDSQGRHWRSYVPDGDFGTAAGEPNWYHTGGQFNGGVATGRNQYAGDWPLLRHAMLLYGGTAAGEPPQSGVDEAIICNDREYAPFIRDMETSQRFLMLGVNAYRGPSWAYASEAFDGGGGSPITWYNPNDASRPRLGLFGRVDICAQSPEEVQRWLEGYDLIEQQDASPFDDGRFDAGQYGVTAPPEIQDFDSALWGHNGAPAEGSVPLDRGVFSAIAGCFSRMMCETEPPVVNRGDEYNPEDSCDSVMDTHAVLAGRCSNFEVAWSDPQSRWRADVPPVIPLPLDPRTDERLSNIKSGDVIWYDYDFPRRLLVPMSEFTAPGLGYTQLDSDGFNEGRQSDPEILHSSIASLNTLGMPANLLKSTSEWREGKLWFSYGLTNIHPVAAGALGPNYLGYDWKLTGGAADEYMAVFPYRVPDVGASGDATAVAMSDDRYVDQAFAKPQFVRIRMTLHDSQMRLEEGKDFEFIFLVDMQ